MPRESNPGALAGEQIVWLGEPFGGWVSPVSSTSGSIHFLASIEGNEAATYQKQAMNQYAESGGVSLFTYEKFGHIAPGNGFSAVSDSSVYITDLPLNGGVEGSASSYGVIVLANGRVIQIDEGGSPVANKYDPTDGGTHTLSHSLNGDMILFRDYQSTPVEWVVWSYEYASNANADIAIAHASNLGTNTDLWYSAISGATALTPGVPHKLCAGPDGNIYVTDGPYVQQIKVDSGTALGSATWGNRLSIGSGWTALGICSYKNYVAIIASSKTTNYSYAYTRVFLWTGISTTVDGVVSNSAQYIYDIQDNFGNGIHFDGLILRAFTSGRNNSSKIFQLTSKGFEKAFETPFIPAGSTGSTNLLQGSVDYFQDGLIIGAVKGDGLGHIFRYYNGGFHDDAYLSDGDNLTGNVATSVGMVKNLFSNKYFVGIGYSGTYKIYYKDTSRWQCCTGASNNIEIRTIMYTEGIIGRRQYPFGYKMTVSRIKIFLSEWGANSALYLSLFNGYDTCLPGNTNAANGGIDLLNLLIDTNTTIPSGFNNLITGANPGNYDVGYFHKAVDATTREIDISDVSITNLSSFYLNVRWTHGSPTDTPAVIRRIEIHVAQSQ